MYHLEHHHRHHHHPHSDIITGDLDIENEAERYEIADALVKHADSLQELANKDIEKYKNNSDDHSSIVRLEHDMHHTLKERTENDVRKYLNNSEDYSILIHLEHDIHRVESVSQIVHNMSQMENMTEHQLRNFHLLELELLALENRVEEEIYHLEHHHHQRQIIAGDYDKDALLKKAQQLISEAEDAVKKYGQGKHIDVQVINNEVVILKNLVKEINEATNPQALTMLEANLAEHEEIIRFEIESGQYEIADALIKHSDTLKNCTENYILKYLNHSEEDSNVKHLKIDIHLVDVVSNELYDMLFHMKNENITEHQLSHFLLLKLELLVYGNRVEKEIYHLEHSNENITTNNDFDLEIKNERYEIADLLLKHADMLKEMAEKDIQKYQNFPEDHSSIIYLKHDIQRIEHFYDYVHNNSRMENIDEDVLHHFHYMEKELLTLENRIEKEIFHLEYHHHHRQHEIIAGDYDKDALSI
ncbi:hypothetical protein DERP_010795 [Dermatophagoides pteronyssinus]|uniref:Septation ring formation regulator EzrA n=1 Tax=Dermatophagoides pteronyssinus TaxID=6956 RepID=A0ABQ8J7B5_DERPT|nr:hypothetical protein DERP_010795 [Dermatophagoides pteronyssinus]